MYKEYWLKTFDYKGISKVSELLTCIFINFIILALITLVGLFVPVSMENGVVNLYYIVLFIMILPTIAMIVRVLNGKKR